MFFHFLNNINLVKQCIYAYNLTHTHMHNKNINIYFVAFGKALLQCLACLLPFLDHDLIDNLSYLTASTISVLPMELHEEIVNYLCFHILPFTISKYLHYIFVAISLIFIYYMTSTFISLFKRE